MEPESPETSSPPKFRDLGQKPPRQELPLEVAEKIKNMTQKEYRKLSKGNKPGRILPGAEHHTSGFVNFQNKEREYRGTVKD